MNQKWKDCTFVAFDTETSGAYPIGSEVVEFGAVKWSQGQIVDELQFLAKPREPMTDFIIGIHGITNEMVALEEPFSTRLSDVHQFFQGSYLMAHHAAFDLGFIAYDFEMRGMSAPENAVLCTSLLSQKLISGCENHKLQTLVKFLNINGGAAHRALDDARACLEVGLQCFAKAGMDEPLESLFKIQGRTYLWNQFLMSNIPSEIFDPIRRATLEKRKIEIRYKKDSREVLPLGIVRTPDGDYMSAICSRDGQRKRFYLSSIKEIGLF